MSRYRDQVAAALQAVTVRGLARYAWLGRASRPLPAALEAEMDELERRRYLVSCLREELYWSFYCRGRPVTARWGEPEPVAADPWLEAAMSEANTGRGSWELGWTVERLEAEDAVVTTPRLRTRVSVAHCQALDGHLRPGVAVGVRIPKELPALSPGFYTVVGEAEAGAAPSAGIVRVYWNVGCPGAPLLVRALTSRLNERHVPFRLKVANHPSRFDRCDVAVLYLPVSVFRPLHETLQHVAAELTGRLRPQIPAFTLELAPGVGLAEDEGTGDSFGVRRCALLADAIARAHERGIAGADGRLQAAAVRFAEDHVSIDAPYREPSFAGRHVL